MPRAFKSMSEITAYLRVVEGRLNELEKQRTNPLVFSYLALRTTIGVLGMALPFVVSLGALIVFGTGLQSSISAYYHTGTRDVFVGTLWVIGFFLFSYKGYERVDDIAGNLACLFAVGVAIFPTAADKATDPTLLAISILHSVFAGLFFVTLIYFCLALFTKTNPRAKPTPQKIQRNQVYRACGYAMILCLVLMTAFTVLPRESTSVFQFYHPVFWLEALAIFAFGVSWFTKGEAILKDE